MSCHSWIPFLTRKSSVNPVLCVRTCMDGFRNVYLCRGPSYHRELSGPVRPLNAVGIYSGGSSDGTRISRCPAHLLKINAKWITLPDRQQARHCHVMISLPTEARISCVYKGVLESRWSAHVSVCCSSSSSIFHLNLQKHREPFATCTDSFLFPIKQTDKMKFSALVSALFVALAAAACKEGAYSWYV